MKRPEHKGEPGRTRSTVRECAHFFEEVHGKVGKVVCFGDAAKAEGIFGLDIGFEAVPGLEQLEQVEQAKVILMDRRALSNGSCQHFFRLCRIGVRLTDRDQSESSFHANPNKVIADEHSFTQIARDDR